MVAMDGKTELKMSSFQAPKIRLLRSMSIQNEVMQVLSLGKSLDCIWGGGDDYLPLQFVLTVKTQYLHLV